MAQKSNRKERRARRAAMAAAVVAKPNPPTSGQTPTDGSEKLLTPLERVGKLQEDIAAMVADMSPRHVKFAMAIAEGTTQAQAAIDAGYAPANARQQGSEVAARPDVQRLVELELTFDVLTHALIKRPVLRRVLGDVMQDGAHSDKVAAVRAAMKLEGYEQQKLEVTGVGVTINPEDLRKQLAERLARQRGQKQE